MKRARSVEPPPRPAAEVEQWCERWVAQCRIRHLRVTPQRVAVYRALAAHRGHPTADQVYEQLHPSLAALSRATVYRVLESLEAEGMIRRVGSNGGATRYDANLAPHQHLVCRHCGRIEDYHPDDARPLPLPARVPGGFRAEEIDLRIIGSCKNCRQAPSFAGTNRGTPRPRSAPTA